MKTIILSTTLALFLFSGCGGGASKDDKKTSPTTTISSTSKVNKAPVATFDKFSINRGIDYNGQLQATDEDGDEIKYTIVQQPSHGSVILHDNGCFTYTPNDGYTGTDTFSYKASDDVSSCAVKTVTIDVSEKSLSKPTAPSDMRLHALSSSKIKIIWSDNATNEDGYEVFIDGNLVRVKNSNETIAYVCGLNAGQTYTVEVRAKNAAGVSESISKTVTTKDVTTLPIAPTELKVVSKDKTSVRLSWRDNANNESSYEIYQDGVLVKSVSARCSCVLICDLDSCKDYTFEVRAKNKIGESASATVDVMTDGCVVEPINTPPVAKDINITKEYDGAFGFDIELIGTDEDGDTLTYTIVSGPTLGSIDSLNGNIITYHSTPLAEPAIITYKVNDGKADSNIATVTINMIPVLATNHAPIAQNQTITMNEDDPYITIQLEATDVDGDALTYTLIQGSSGAVGDSAYDPDFATFQTGGKVGFSLNQNANGTEILKFKVNDGTIDSNIATVTINVAPVNDKPTADAKSVTVEEDSVDNAITLSGNDIDGDTLSFIKTSDPSHGFVTMSGNIAKYTPTPNYFGSDSFTYKVNDGTVDSDTVTVNIQINKVSKWRLKSINNINFGDETFEYDENGTLLSSTFSGEDGRGFKYYDEFENILQVDYTDFEGVVRETVKYRNHYNTHHNLVQKDRYGDGFDYIEELYEYHPNGVLSKKTHNQDDGTIEYIDTYDESGKISTKKFIASGDEYSYFYNDKGNLTSIKNNGENWKTYTYEYNTDGTIKKEIVFEEVGLFESEEIFLYSYYPNKSKHFKVNDLNINDVIEESDDIIYEYDINGNIIQLPDGSSQIWIFI